MKSISIYYIFINTRRDITLKESMNLRISTLNLDWNGTHDHLSLGNLHHKLISLPFKRFDWIPLHRESPRMLDWFWSRHLLSTLRLQMELFMFFISFSSNMTFPLSSFIDHWDFPFLGSAWKTLVSLFLWVLAEYVTSSFMVFSNFSVTLICIVLW